MAGHLGKSGNMFLLVVAACAAAGCVSDPLNGQRVARYRPNLYGRDVVHVRESAEPSVAGSSTTNDYGVVSSVSGDPAEGATRTLQRGDRVVIYLFGIPQPAEINDVIDDRGNVKLPLIESVKIGDRTTYEAEKMIESAYVDGGYYRKIEISVVAMSIVPRADECYLRGEVKGPGRYPWSADLTLTKAIIAAGGFTEYANARKVQVRRGETSQVYDTKDIERGKAKDPPVKAGDIIIVHRGLM